MVTADIAISVDGYAAGPNQSLENPFGEGVEGPLHRWMFEEPEAGERLFDGAPNVELEPLAVRQTPLVTHLSYRVAR